jgi:L-lysine exporter family protein LysE/ArgO
MDIETPYLTVAALHGAILALSLILPIGPQNLFVFSQGASGTLPRAIAVACAAAVCDGLHILGGVLGFSAPLLALPGVTPLLMGGGVAFLTYLGFVNWRAAPAVLPAAGDGRPSSDASLGRCVLFACTVSLLNPHAILDTVAVIGGSSLSYSGLPRVSFTVACMGVSWLWFIGLVAMGRLVATIPLAARSVNKVSAVSLWVCALILGGAFIGRGLP